MECFVCVNGNLVPGERAVLPALDRGFLYGWGLFETFLVKNGEAEFLEEHLERLKSSAPRLGLTLPDQELIKYGIREVIAENSLAKGSLRLTVSAGVEAAGKPTMLITVKKGSVYRQEHYSRGFKAGFLSTPRNESSPLVYVKSLNYLENILGRQEALARGWNEGLFLNTRGFLTEGTVSNVFLVTKANELVTPEIRAGLLPGIMRAKVLEKAGAAGCRCIERAVKPEELFSARECFLTNSLMVVMPLVEIEGRPVGNGRPGEITRKLMRKINQAAP
ncbi:aminotransferase class IV [Desulfolucanica intricata]|uniref:aminotransferase class IV n=1 Tax=Desulfolucanica intricata TaxID=1285191 RepID=UPI0008345F35|nr:aminotransferase class IV [Desulfolucanica intricata]